MQPSPGFWDSIGIGLSGAPGWLILLALFLIAALFVLAKWWLPEWRQDRADRRVIEARRVELEAKAQQNSDSQARDRIRLTERQLDIQADQTRALEALTAQTTLLNAQLDASRKRSAHMGEVVDATAETLGHVAERVDEIHEMVGRHIGGTD